MTYSVAATIRAETANLDDLSRSTRAYFQSRTRNRLYDHVMRKYREKRDGEGLTQLSLAKRMGRRPDALNRLLARPSNWTIDTLSDLLLAICGEELDVSSTSPLSKPKRNRGARDLIKPPQTVDMVMSARSNNAAVSGVSYSSDQGTRVFRSADSIVSAASAGVPKILVME